MRKKIWSNFILVAMISMCIGAVASPGANSSAIGGKQIVSTPSLSESADDLTRSLLLADAVFDLEASDSGAQPTPAKSITERALEDAAQSAGEVVSELEMPFFSFGGSASSE